MPKGQKKNAFAELLDNLNKNKLGHNQVQIAYRAWVRQSKNIPDGIKDLLCGKEGYVSLLYEAFSLISQIIGNMELAYRRGYSAGLEEAKKKREFKPKKIKPSSGSHA